jgi:ABC-type sugar transport system permease subunit
MKLRSFVGFTAPSALLMLLLLALPLAMTLGLSVRNCTPVLELVTVQQSGPFGTHEVTTQRARLGADGRVLQDCRFVGADYYRAILGLGRDDTGSGEAVPPPAGQPVEFWRWR